MSTDNKTIKTCIGTLAIAALTLACALKPAQAEVIATVQRAPLKLGLTNECHDANLCRVIFSEPGRNSEEWTGWYRTGTMRDENGDDALFVSGEDNAHWLIPLKDLKPANEKRLLALIRR